jgi:hypothetical protein
MISADEWACIKSDLQNAYDQSLPLYRPENSDTTYGQTETPVPQGNIQCSVFNPSATTLQTYASVIGSLRSLMLRALDTTDIRENDLVDYDGLRWRVQKVLDGGSFSVQNEYLMTVKA